MEIVPSAVVQERLDVYEMITTVPVADAIRACRSTAMTDLLQDVKRTACSAGLISPKEAAELERDLA